MGKPTLIPLILREMAHRKTGVAIGLVSVAAAMGGMVGAITLVDAHQTRTGLILNEREKETRIEMRRLEDDYRRIMRELGHNVMILHRDQSRARLRTEGYPEVDFPEEYVHRLARGNIETLNHLLPVLQKRIVWPEFETEIILTGTPGQIPVAHLTAFLTEDGQAYRNPILPPVPPGRLLIGHDLAREIHLRPGDRVKLMGEPFVIAEVHPQQGDQRDIMVWCDLPTVQRWLGKPGRINAIFALECVCEIDALGKITEEVQSILPDAQVMEFSSRVIARGQARQRAEEEAARAIAAEIRHRNEVLESLRGFASILVPAALFGSGVWIFFLVLANVRERKTEIGILRAIGVRQSAILFLFVGKAVLIGCAGAVPGYLGGTVIGATAGGIPLASADFPAWFDPLLFFLTLFIAAALSAAAAWAPAFRAAQSDPATVLRES